MSAKKKHEQQVHRLWETNPPGQQSAGCLFSLPVVPIAVSLVLVTAKKITHRQRGER